MYIHVRVCSRILLPVSQCIALIDLFCCRHVIIIHSSDSAHSSQSPTSAVSSETVTLSCGPPAWTVLRLLPQVSHMCILHMFILLMRDEKEGRRSKQGKINKVKQHSTPNCKAVIILYISQVSCIGYMYMSLFIRCTMRCEIWVQPAELPR